MTPRFTREILFHWYDRFNRNASVLNVTFFHLSEICGTAGICKKKNASIDLLSIPHGRKKSRSCSYGEFLMLNLHCNSSEHLQEDLDASLRSSTLREFRRNDRLGLKLNTEHFSDSCRTKTSGQFCRLTSGQRKRSLPITITFPSGSSYDFSS